jgi:hypothetical protein
MINTNPRLTESPIEGGVGAANMWLLWFEAWSLTSQASSAWDNTKWLCGLGTRRAGVLALFYPIRYGRGAALGLAKKAPGEALRY